MCRTTRPKYTLSKEELHLIGLVDEQLQAHSDHLTNLTDREIDPLGWEDDSGDDSCEHDDDPVTGGSDE